ncbi:polysaccharide pyruvyl transferase family protein [Geobacter benzoatilyticus]|uniref:Polysaccharide pyruvyl transferase family protein n=1 Tax=Geobacter benzoatilyticus TaxID=2815309 RepID=A0ABX7Q0K0_9BACT|nr:polysaccharide pyruvyl transferase family protein [Geobacter benzoatilyticus]QSV44854.1 polysaccharide pyruvyl transferase family protein [Geobacter benzoatilyticus]
MLKKISFINKVFGYVWEWFVNPGRLKPSTFYPRVLNLLVTEQCNCRCLMCNIWERGDKRILAIKELHDVLADGLFANILHVGISGGEPTLRGDLPELIDVITGVLPKLKSISITTNGTNPEFLGKALPDIKKNCLNNNIDFTLNISIDGLDVVHDNIRQRPGTFRQVILLLNLARQLDIQVQIQCTVSERNVYCIEGVRYLAKQYGVDLVYRLATDIQRLNNHEKIKSIALNPDQKSFFADFLTSPATFIQTKLPSRRLFYSDLATRLLDSNKRSAPCYFKNEGVMLSASGELFTCSICSVPLGNVIDNSASDLYFSAKATSIRTLQLTSVCQYCWHDQSGAWSPIELFKGTLFWFRVYGLSNKIRTAIMFFSYGYYLSLRASQLTNHSSAFLPPLKSTDEKRALLVGCYGGEHVGDAAILGGVLQRLSRDFNISKAVVASSRIDRTRRWVNSLRNTIPVEVINYKHDVVNAEVSKCDYLVFAGGPLMDLPGLLIKHLEVAIYAYNLSIPILIEGCGIGPFKFTLSQQLVKRILRMASHIRLRTQASVDIVAELCGCKALLDKDPAYDYIDTLTKENTLRDFTPESLVPLVDTEKIIIGINLRPLWQKYAKGFVPMSKITNIEERFLLEFANALLKYKDKVRYIFFPMNPDQYGFSDLSIAYRLKEMLPDELDFHVWEYEPNVDEVLSLLKKVSGCITMRFHASIFSLSHNIKTIGIDYGIGKKSKVWDLFSEAKLTDNVINVEEFTCDWLVQQLHTTIKVHC